MSKARPGYARKTLLDEMLDFGPDESQPTTKTGPASDDVTARLQRLLKQIQEISRRIDDLSHRD